ncbi:MAG: hypothetical protein KatS3mg060_2691 [Dehalococcoidia bacterium]|nr:MAG: hypothetical protein KatS3mg060_2691 [Dehalococcoidia bacterium]
MTNQPPNRATERIARRKELRQSRILEAQRRRTNRARLRIVLAIVITLVVGLVAWLGIVFFLPPAAAFAGLALPAAKLSVAPTTASQVGWPDIERGMFFWLGS